MITAFIVFYFVECALTKWCPESFHFANDSGSFKSPTPHGALLYPDNINCEWSITIPEAYLHVKLSFKTFHLEDCPKCKCDYVEIFDVIGPNKISLGKFCGSVLPGPFFSAKQSLLVVFKSDHGNSYTGFTASYTSVLPGAACRNATRLYSSKGSIHSPEFSSAPYPNNMDCVWQITTPPNTRMKLTIRVLSIQSCGKMGTSDACSCDFVEIRDGNSSRDHLLTKLCGSKLPKVLYSSSRYVWVRFKSDGDVADSGFVASFSSATIIEGFSCPASWKYPLRCPKEFNLKTNKTGACCYDNGPSCCEPGGRRCTGKGASLRDYCPRPKDDKKLKYCCMKEGQPSCCASLGVYHKVRLILLLGVIAHVSCLLIKSCG